MKKKLIFKIIRIVLYLILFISFMIIPTSFFEKNHFCVLYDTLGYLCPACGITRSFSHFMHGMINEAYNYNPVFIITILPIFIFLFIEDIICTIITIINKKEIKSLIESIA